MQDRTQGGVRPSADVEEDTLLSDGFVARLADHVFENPAMSGGLFVMALTAAAIVSNAMMMQNGHHPDPLFMTRPMPAAHTPVPLPRTRAGLPVRAPVPVPLPRQAPAAQPAAAPVAPPPDAKLIADVQRALAVKHLYRGAADGIAGTRTRAAISAYEKSAGLPVTGFATSDLLAHLRSPTKQLAAVKPVSAGSRPAATPAAIPAVQPAVAAAAAAPAEQTPAPVPAARQAIEAIAAPPTTDEATPADEAAPDSAPGVAARQAIEPAAAPQASDPVAPVAEAAPDPGPAADAPPGPPDAAASPPPVAPAPSAEPASALPAAPVAATPVQPVRDPAIGDRQRYRSVQNALNQAGYGPLTAGGIPNEETASAIRRFELDNGLPITGKPGDRVAARLVSIGAMQAN